MKKVEVYYDPSGFVDGIYGCWKVRLASDHAIWDAGITQGEAKLAFLKTAASFGMSGSVADYLFVDIGRQCDNPAGVKEVADLICFLRRG